MLNHAAGEPRTILIADTNILHNDNNNNEKWKQQ